MGEQENKLKRKASEEDEVDVQLNNLEEGNNGNATNEPINPNDIVQEMISDDNEMLRRYQFPIPRKMTCIRMSPDPDGLSFHNKYNNMYFKESLADEWRRYDTSSDYGDPETGCEIYRRPFKICLLPDFLQDAMGKNVMILVKEIMSKVEWCHKRIDLYEFYQSNDLETMRKADVPYLYEYLQLLWFTIKPWLESVTDMSFHKISASCSMYNCGDHLLVHDDLLGDRKIAFIYYLTPWFHRKIWQPEHGGCLEILGHDSNGLPQLPPIKLIPPRNNQFIFFEVGSKSFHQVGEVKSYEYPRLTINGWFHGVSNKPAIEQLPFNLVPSFPHPTLREAFHSPLTDTHKKFTNELLNDWLNPIYMLDESKKTIQESIEANSEIGLQSFLKAENYSILLAQLLNDERLRWTRQGPANVRNYEMLDLNTATECLREFIDMLRSEVIFQLFHEYTELDLAGKGANRPRCYLEVQRWTNGDYTILTDDTIKDENTLDIWYFLNSTDGAGIINYVTVDNEDFDAFNNDSSDDDDYDDDDNVECDDSEKDEMNEDLKSEKDADGATKMNTVYKLIKYDEKGALENLLNDDSDPAKGGHYNNTEEAAAASSSLPSTSSSKPASTSPQLFMTPMNKRKINPQKTVTDSVLLSVSPVDNSLNMVFNGNGTAKFVKYISHRIAMPNGPLFTIMCSYKE